MDLILTRITAEFELHWLLLDNKNQANNMISEKELKKVLKILLLPPSISNVRNIPIYHPSWNVDSKSSVRCTNQTAHNENEPKEKDGRTHDAPHERGLTRVNFLEYSLYK